jgi:hypothetical protein
MLTWPLAPKDLQPSSSHTDVSKAELLPLLTPPWKFPRDVLGLSLYFITKGSIIALMLVLSIIAVMPLSENLGADNFSNTFRLIERRLSDGYEWGALAQWTEVEVAECPQTSAVRCACLLQTAAVTLHPPIMHAPAWIVLHTSFRPGLTASTSMPQPCTTGLMQSASAGLPSEHSIAPAELLPDCTGGITGR